MEWSSCKAGEWEIPVLTLEAAVIGSGCAGFNAADWLYNLGVQNIAILTEGVNMGTSRNTGSDKQTYYKQSVSSEQDSVADVARTLFAGGGVQGDIAYTEAANSLKCFMKLTNLGVPFPCDPYGVYVGYRTDHDPRPRATSAGPYTSRYMTECLERSVRSKAIPILDRIMAIRLLTHRNSMEGVLCLNLNRLDTPEHGLCVVRSNRVILATGGPAGCYARSVYPESQFGMSGMALEAGAQGANLHQWQYGLASLKFRWNVSGTYQQVLPRYISIDEQGVEREFLGNAWNTPEQALGMIFRKGYEWPFDVTKAEYSSRIDLLVQYETSILGRRVFLDFRRNPSGLAKDFSNLDEDAFAYLQKSNALFATPYERLVQMNPQAVALYMEHGIDLEHEPLEIGVCAQHHNGGLQVDADWQTTVSGLYCAGEAAGTFGAGRPGGAALNSTQVGSMRAAEHIASNRQSPAYSEEFLKHAGSECEELLGKWQSVLSRQNARSIWEQRQHFQTKMSDYAGHLRQPEGICALEQEIREELAAFYQSVSLKSMHELPELLRNHDLLITQLAVLSAMQQAADRGSGGSALVCAQQGKALPLGPDWTLIYAPVIKKSNDILLTVAGCNGFSSSFEPVKPLPQPDEWFETVWHAFTQRTKRNDLK